jgi:hypothetical protein
MESTVGNLQKLKRGVRQNMKEKESILKNRFMLSLNQKQVINTQSLMI